MQDKRLLILAILGIGAIVSLFYGITAPPKISRTVLPRPAPLAAGEREMIYPTERAISTERHAKRTNFAAWGRNPFVIKEAGPFKKGIVKLSLNGILWDKEKPLAIINNEMVGIGSEIAGNKVVDITPDRVVLNDGISDFELKIGE